MSESRRRQLPSTTRRISSRVGPLPNRDDSCILARSLDGAFGRRQLARQQYPRRREALSVGRHRCARTLDAFPHAHQCIVAGLLFSPRSPAHQDHRQVSLPILLSSLPIDNSVATRVPSQTSLAPPRLSVSQCRPSPHCSPSPRRSRRARLTPAREPARARAAQAQAYPHFILALSRLRSNRAGLSARKAAGLRMEKRAERECNRNWPHDVWRGRPH